jgi:alkylresorcinol/alkylpyrone synthase
MGNEMSLIVSNAIFGDGAAAAIIWNRPQGVEFVDSSSFYDPVYREDVRYTHRNGRLYNQISPGLPKILEKKVPPFTIDFLSKHSLTPQHINHWALHPGGEKIISGLEERFGIAHEKLDFSRDIMKRCGNMSSPTVLFELEQIMKGDCRPGDLGIILAFGAGLSIHGALLRW